jgi:hypothetical protein
MSIGKIKMATTAGHNIKVRGPYWKNVLKELLSEVPVIPILLKSKLYMSNHCMIIAKFSFKIL